jgi:hypothetical protein
MKLPQDLQPRFIHPTLIVAADHVVAKMFLAGGDEVEELDGVSEPREKRQDSEGFFMSWDGSRHGGPDADISDEPRLAEYAKKVAKRIATLVHEQDLAHIHLVMPNDVSHLVQKALPNDVKKKIVHVRDLDLMKEDTLTILRRAYEIPS